MFNNFVVDVTIWAVLPQENVVVYAGSKKNKTTLYVLNFKLIEKLTQFLWLRRPISMILKHMYHAISNTFSYTFAVALIQFTDFMELLAYDIRAAPGRLWNYAISFLTIWDFCSIFSTESHFPNIPVCHSCFWIKVVVTAPLFTPFQHYHSTCHLL